MEKRSFGKSRSKRMKVFMLRAFVCPCRPAHRARRERTYSITGGMIEIKMMARMT